MIKFWFYILFPIVFVLLVLYSYNLLYVDDNNDNNDNIHNPTISHENWAEKLGFPTAKRVIILHADDIGMCPEANNSAKRYLKGNLVKSASVMMPCKYAEDFILWANKNPTKDIGLHLTLNSEWNSYKWRPLSKRNIVPGLVDLEGKFWSTREQIIKHSSPEEIEIELRAQIEKSIVLGHYPNHLDSHMGTLYASNKFLQVYLKLAEEYHIPAMIVDVNKPEILEMYKSQGFEISEEMIKTINHYKLPKLDLFISIDQHSNSYKSKKESFFNLVSSLPPGLTEIFFHPSDKSENLKCIMNEWRQRSWEAKLFEDYEVEEFLKRENIVLTDWKDIMSRFENLHL